MKMPRMCVLPVRRRATRGPLQKRSAASAAALSIAALAAGMAAAPAPAVVPTTPPNFQTDPNGFIEFFLTHPTEQISLNSHFGIEINGVLKQCAIDVQKVRAPVIDPALCVQLDQLLDQQSGDDNQGDDNQGDNNQGDNNQGDNNQGDNNQGDNNQGDLFSPSGKVDRKSSGKRQH